MNKEQENFISYNNLSYEDSCLFFGANLHYFLNKASPILFSDRKKDNGSEIPNYHTFESLREDQEDLSEINLKIKYLLELIGKYSNSDYGSSAMQQHNFFKRNGERETFFKHLFSSIQGRKREILLKKYPLNESEENKSLWKKIDSTHFDKVHFEYEKLGVRELYFTVNGRKFSEKQLYATAVFYMIGFAFEAIKSNEPLLLSIILSNLSYFKDGTSYLQSYGAIGGKNRVKEGNKKLEQAYQIFYDQDLYIKNNKKTEAIIREISPFLRRNKISVSTTTLRTKWIPEFIERYERNYLKNKNN